MVLEMNYKHPSSRCPWVLGRGSLFMSSFSERLHAIECAHLRNLYWSLGPWYGTVQMGEHQKVGPWGKELIHGFTSFRKDYCISRENLVRSLKNLPGLWMSWLSQLSHECVFSCHHSPFKCITSDTICVCSQNVLPELKIYGCHTLETLELLWAKRETSRQMKNKFIKNTSSSVWL